LQLTVSPSLSPCTHAHKHTHTHTHAQPIHTRTDTHTHTQPIQTHSLTHTHIQHAYTPSHPHTRIHTISPTPTPTNTSRRGEQMACPSPSSPSFHCSPPLDQQRQRRRPIWKWARRQWHTQCDWQHTQIAARVGSLPARPPYRPAAAAAASAAAAAAPARRQQSR
jgi:hypothetical protein